MISCGGSTPRGGLYDVSSAMAERLGASVEELAGEFAALATPRAVGFGDGAPGLAACLFARRPFSRCRAVISGRSGRRTWSISGRPVSGANGAFEGFIGAGTDVTDADRVADLDVLTGLINRSYFEREALAQLALRRGRSRRMVVACPGRPVT